MPVTARGRASVVHSPTASAMTASALCPSSVKPSGAGASSTAAKASRGVPNFTAATLGELPKIFNPPVDSCVVIFEFRWLPGLFTFC